MSQSFKRTAWILTFVFVVLSTAAGVWTARTLANTAIGQTVTMGGLDQESADASMINFLVLGVDEDGTRSDTIMLFSYDGYSNRTNILSFPRDTMVKTGGWTQKLNAAMGVGMQNVKRGIDAEPEEEMIRQIKDLTGLPIHYVMTIGFHAFKEIIDALGGVDFNVPYNMDYDDPYQNLHIHLQAGPQHLDGQAAHDFVRFRHNNNGSAPGEYVWGDEGRIHWQQIFMKELAKQKMTPQILGRIDEIFEVISRNVKTNYTMQDLLKHLNFVDKIKVEEIGSYQLPGGAEYVGDVSYYLQDRAATETLIRDVFLPRTAEEWNAQQTLKAAEQATAEAQNVE